MSAALKRIWPALILVATFTVLLAVGLLLGGYGKVMANAIVICLDCIGLI